MALPQLNISPVVFNAEEHTYRLGDKYLKGITNTLVRRAYPNTYKTPENMSEEQWRQVLNKAAVKGTAIHETIELYEGLGVVSDLPELKNYIAIKESNGFVNLASEYLVSDEENYASAIDHVFCTEDGRIVLVDIKRTAELHKDDVTCQLSIYKRWFERQNPHLKVDSIAVMWLRGEKWDFKVLTPLPDEVIDALIEADLKDEEFDIQRYYGELPMKLADAEEQIIRLEAEIKEKNAIYNDLKSGLLGLMEKYDVKKFSGSRVTLSRTEPTTRASFDSSSFKHDYPDLYNQYMTTSDVKSSLRITIKK